MQYYKLLLLLLFPIVSYAQNEANIWYFGENAGLDFSSGSPVAITDGALNTIEGCATIADNTGNLLFYTDGSTVFDTNHNPMPNGGGLFGNSSSTQSAIIVPKPESTDLFYIFTVDEHNNNLNGLNYSTVDITLNGGLGDVTLSEKNINLLQHSTEKITAVKGDCNEVWVIAYAGPNGISMSNNNTFHAYKVTSTGVAPSVSSTVGFSISDGRGYLKVSPDGSKIAIVHTGAFAGGVKLYDFDNTTGQVTNGIDLPLTDPSNPNNNPSTSPYGVEFSLDSSVLYVTSTETYGNSGFNSAPCDGFLWQYDLSQVSPNSLLVAFNPNDTYRGALQMGPDGKIYRALSEHYDLGTSSLGVINNPQTIGVGCDYQHAVVSLGGRISRQGLPPFISSLLLPVEISDSDTGAVINNQDVKTCIGESISFSPEAITGSSVVYTWVFDNGTTQTQLSSGANPNLTISNVTFSDEGNYALTINTTDSCGNIVVLNGEFNLLAFEVPTANTISNLEQCDNDFTNDEIFDLETTFNPQILLGQDPAIFEVFYYESQVDLDNDNPIANATDYAVTLGSKTLIAQIRNNGNPICANQTSFTIDVFSPPNPTPPSGIPSIAFCDDTLIGDTNDGFINTFDLETHKTLILNGSLETDVVIEYYLDAALTNLIPTVTLNSYTNSTPFLETIYVKISNVSYLDCYNSTSFDLIVHPAPEVNTPVLLVQCDDDNDGFISFDLTQVNSDIVTNITIETFSYYTTESDALAGIGTNEITNPNNYTNNNTPLDTVWVRVETDQSCFFVVEATIEVSISAAILNNYLESFYECDDGSDTRDGVSTFDLTGVQTNIESFFPFIPVDVIFYETETDAINEDNPIVDISAHQNTSSPNFQTIWVRVDSASENDCIGYGPYVTVTVEALPFANQPSAMEICDDDNDGSYGFDTSTLNNEILNGQFLSDVTIEFIDTNTGTSYTDNLPNPFNTSSQTMDIIVTNRNTNDPDGACSEQTTIDFTVYESPINNSISFTALCDENLEDNLVTATFDTSTLQTDIGAQATMIVTFYDNNGNPLSDIDGNPITNPFPSSFVTESQTITVEVTNPLSTICSNIQTIDFIVNPRPNFSVPQDLLVCENLVPFEINIENPLDNYEYLWYNNNNQLIGSGTPFHLTETETIDTEYVTYSVVATNPITGCNKEETFTIKKSSIATIEPTTITSDEFNNHNNSIIINTDNLGSGDYEYSLEHSWDTRPYQTEPLFTNLTGGDYIISITDTNGCGTVSENITLLDYPRFFTPNNDGENDYWQLIGINGSSSLVSAITIFDRHGKTLALIDPQGKGWDGFYNGAKLPATDYWFKAELIDSNGVPEEYLGHFSLVRR